MTRTHDRIICSLPYPTKIIGLTINRPRTIGFLFTNKASFLFREASGLKTSDDLKAWVNKNGGETALVTEMLYWAAVAYCEEVRQPDNFTKDGLRIAVASSEKQIQEAILTTWKQSETFGATVKPDKKKVKPKPYPVR